MERRQIRPKNLMQYIAMPLVMSSMEHSWHLNRNMIAHTQGRRPGGGTVPPKFEVGDGPCIGPPPIFREVVLSDARERMIRAKNGLIKEFFSEIVVFLVEKGSHMTFYHSKQQKI